MARKDHPGLSIEAEAACDAAGSGTVGTAAAEGCGASEVLPPQRPSRPRLKGTTMTTTAIRLSLIGAGEHIAACRLLGTDDYSNAEYAEAVSAVRESGAGERYADRVLGVDVDALIRGVEADHGESICQ